MKKIKSNRFVAFSAVISASMLLSACMQDHNEVQYSKVMGYETRVAEKINMDVAKQLAANNVNVQTASAVPVIINNPLAIGQNLGRTSTPATPSVAAPVAVASADPAALSPNPLVSASSFANIAPAAGGTNLAYGSLNSGAVQSGVIMQSYTPQQQPLAYGSIYTPTRTDE